MKYFIGLLLLSTGIASAAEGRFSPDVKTSRMTVEEKLVGIISLIEDLNDTLDGLARDMHSIQEIAEGYRTEHFK